MTARGWALPLALLVFGTSACGSDDHERLLTGDDPGREEAGWERDEEAPPSLIRIYEGETHCDKDSALILDIHWPLDGDSTERAGHVFVRDPEGVLAEETAGPFVPDAELPEDAIPTGWEHGTGLELWLADDLSTAYAVDGDTVEAWPARTRGEICA
ncbi:hypothetical protein [Blastococcus goldschmidtiae]|uniref:Lipoprotein n=1 Tax=Blastococcus goldschmidtiae TaxID=3075546 RepID=A0ABU2KBN3_9ACTN|nr:hypothetical protein [Blastococcus sp. DSM 46792]MDT0277592.1 hypothetical protein [Blastococcus sp. DSM 46792]